MFLYFVPLLSEKSDVGFPVSIFSRQSARTNVVSTYQGPKILFLAVRQHGHQDLSEHMKASFSQSEEVFSKGHMTIYN